ncbi:MAG: isocitrate lyase/PEP mutase family protein [Ginsengibacter sp.]
MNAITIERISWKELLQQEKPVLLPVAHDALTARLIEMTGFKAFQIAGFALAGSMHAVPDLDLEHFGEKGDAVRKIISASSLPVMVDADDGYGDVKNVTRTVMEYIRMGVSAIFIEDQKPPIKCGHMGKKHVVTAKHMEGKIKAAVDARQKHNLFLLARTDAIEPENLRHAIKRAEGYLKAGADGVYIEGITDKKQLKEVGSIFKGVPLATSILEYGGKTPWLPPEEMSALGYSMILYPTTVIFQVAYAIKRALGALRAGMPLDEKTAVDMGQFLDIVNIDYWREIENKYSVEE